MKSPKDIIIVEEKIIIRQIFCAYNAKALA